MRTTNLAFAQIRALLVIAVVYVGALAGVAAATEPYQTWQWAMVGAGIGLLIGVVASLVLPLVTSTQPGTPQSATQLPASAQTTAFEIEFPLEGASTNDDCSLDFLLYATYAFIQPTGTPLPDPRVQGQTSGSFDAKNLIESTIAAATTQIVIQRTLEEVMDAEASGTLSQSIQRTANSALEPYDHEIVTLHIKRVSTPEKVRLSRIDQWVAEEEAASAVKIQAASIKPTVSALETAYQAARKEKLSKRRTNEHMLAQSLHMIKSQASPVGLWPDTLEYLLLALDKSLARSGVSRFFRR